MLRQLYIRDFALIDQLEIDFHDGFSVITGETGAGKSIIIGAVSLLWGARADARQVKTGRDKCIVEASFDLKALATSSLKSLFEEYDLDFEEDTCVIRREVNKSGKSRAFVNDTPTTLSVLRQLGEHLLDIHSQHQNLLLANDDFQLHVVDIMAESKDAFREYHSAYEKYVKAVRELEQLKSDIEANSRNRDFLQFQQKELQEAALVENEQEQLEQERDMIAHAEYIQAALHKTDDSLNADDHGIVGQLKSSINSLNDVVDSYPVAKDLADRLQNCYIELKDVAQEVINRMEDVEFDAGRMQEVETRLDCIYSLQQKYHVATIAELLQILENLNQQLDNIENSDAALKEKQVLVSQFYHDCETFAEILTKKRKKAATVVENELRERLVPLGIPNVRFSVDIQAKDFCETGADKVQFLFSANTSSPMQPVARVASGGEIARVMLSLKAMICKVAGMPTIIFDEIDTGVSGKVAEQMARIMKDMGQTHCQVVCITHLPQIAAQGDFHYKVVKTETESGTNSKMVQLTNDERVKEIAQMLSGSEITQAAMDNAAALLNL